MIIGIFKGASLRAGATGQSAKRRLLVVLRDDRRSYDCRLLFPGNRADRIAAGESEDPAKNIPRAVRQVSGESCCSMCSRS